MYQIGCSACTMRRRDSEPWFAPYCRYCGFDIETGQSFMAVTDQGRVTRPYTHPSKRFEDDFRPPWTERDGHIHEVAYRARTGVLIGCHVACFEFATAKFVDVDAAKANDHDHGQSLRLFRATERAFQPSAAYSRRRFDWLRDRLACCVRARYPVLPMELCLMVAGELVPEYAIASLAGVVASSRRDGRGGNGGRRLVDRGDDVWARYVHLDGVRYVASLSNSPGRGHTTRLYAAGRDLEDGRHVRSRPPAGVNLVENHLGIVDLQFYSGKPDYGAEWPTRYVDVQWRSLRFDGGKYFSAISDGVKLRDITNDQSVPSISLPGEAIESFDRLRRVADDLFHRNHLLANTRRDQHQLEEYGPHSPSQLDFFRMLGRS